MVALAVKQLLRLQAIARSVRAMFPLAPGHIEAAAESDIVLLIEKTARPGLTTCHGTCADGKDTVCQQAAPSIAEVVEVFLICPAHDGRLA